MKEKHFGLLLSTRNYNGNIAFQLLLEQDKTYIFLCLKFLQLNLRFFVPLQFMALFKGEICTFLLH